MSTTVSYKGRDIATVSNNTKTLETEGKYLEADIILTDQSTPSLQAKSATPTESAQTITADSGYDGLSQVGVGAISSSYVGSGIPRRSSSDLTASGATVTAPAGYYSASASKTIPNGSATPSATKGAVSNHSVIVTPSVIRTAGYVAAGTSSGTGVTVSASELVSGSQTLSDNGTYDVTNLAEVVVAIPFATIRTGTTTPSSSLGVNGDIYIKTG